MSCRQKRHLFLDPSLSSGRQNIFTILGFTILEICFWFFISMFLGWMNFRFMILDGRFLKNNNETPRKPYFKQETDIVMPTKEASVFRSFNTFRMTKYIYDLVIYDFKIFESR